MMDSKGTAFGNCCRVGLGGLLSVLLAACLVTDRSSLNADSHNPQRQELEALDARVLALSEQLQQLERRSLDATAARAGLPRAVNLLNRSIDVSGLPGKGDADAQVAIIEVTDYQCPYCRAHFMDAHQAIQDRLIDSGLVRYFIYDFPLAGHELAPLAATAARCAGRQGSYWLFHAGLFSLPTLDDQTDISTLAGELGLDLPRFEACRTEAGHRERLDELAALATGLGVRGTPTFFFGLLGEDGRVRDLTQLQGLQDLSAFETRVEQYYSR